MRAIHATFLCAAIVAVMTGCGETRSDNVASPVQPNPVAQPKEVTYPDWVSDPSTGGHFGALGVSRTSLGGTSEELARALANGRTELARSIQTRVQASYTRFFTEGGDLNQGANGGVDAKLAAQEMSENVSRQITNQVLSGSKQKATFRDPNTKELFVWVIIAEDKLDLIKSQVKDAAHEQLAKRAQIGAELKAADALKRLDAAIDQEMARQGGAPAAK